LTRCSNLDLRIPSQTACRVHEPMQRLRSSWQLAQVALENLGEGIEQTPSRSAFAELRVAWLSPLGQYVGDLRDGDHASVKGLDDQVVGLSVRDLVALVRCKPLLLGLTQPAQQADSPVNQLWEVPLDVSRVFAGQLHFPTERQVIAHEHAGTEHQRRW